MTMLQLLQLVDNTTESPTGTASENAILAELEGWDSMSVLSFIVEVERTAGVRLPAAELGKCTTVGDLLVLINAKAA